MLYKTYDIEIDKKPVAFRIPIRAQLDLCKKHKIDKNQIMTLFYEGMDDPEVLIEILETAATFPGNENWITDGAEIYDHLVNEGYSSQAEFVPLLTGIAHSSGFLTEKQKEIIDRLAEEPEITAEDAIEQIKEEQAKNGQAV